MARDFKTVLESAERTMENLARLYEDYTHGILNMDDLRRSVRNALEILGGKKEEIRREKMRLRSQIGGNSPDVFKCFDNKFGEYSDVLLEASSLSLHDTPLKIVGACVKAREVYRLLAETIGMLEGYREYRDIEQLFFKLKKLVLSERLSGLLTFRTTKLLFDRVDEFWARAVYQEGLVALRICGARLNGLLHTTPHSESSEFLTSRLDNIYELGARAQDLVSGNAISGFNEVDELRKLVNKGYLTLAERLVYDLEFVFAPCRTFFREYDRYLQFVENYPAAFIPTDEIRSMISREGWGAAAFELLGIILRSSKDSLILLNSGASKNQETLEEIVKMGSPLGLVEENAAVAD